MGLEEAHENERLSPESFWSFGFPPDVLQLNREVIDENPTLFLGIPVIKSDSTLFDPKSIGFVQGGHAYVVIPVEIQGQGKPDLYSSVDFKSVEEIMLKIYLLTQLDCLRQLNNIQVAIL